jgi:hypothetical protein
VGIPEQTEEDLAEAPEAAQAIRQDWVNEISTPQADWGRSLSISESTATTSTQTAYCMNGSYSR